MKRSVWLVFAMVFGCLIVNAAEPTHASRKRQSSSKQAGAVAAVAVPAAADFTCPTCGRTMTYRTTKPLGLFAYHVPDLKKAASVLPVGYSIDYAGLCPVCGEGKPQCPVLSGSCQSCGKPFSAEIADYRVLVTSCADCRSGTGQGGK